MENSSYFESLEAKAEGKVPWKAALRRFIYPRRPLSAEKRCKIRQSYCHLATDTFFRWERLASAYKNDGSELLRLWLTCNNRFGEEYVATILYQVSLRPAIGLVSARIQLCAVSIKSFLHWHPEYDVLYCFTLLLFFIAWTIDSREGSFYSTIYAWTTSCQPGGVTHTCARGVNALTESMYVLSVSFWQPTCKVQ